MELVLVLREVAAEFALRPPARDHPAGQNQRHEAAADGGQAALAGGGPAGREDTCAMSSAHTKLAETAERQKTK